MITIMLGPSSPRRREAEEFIQKVYLTRHAANLIGFPPNIIACLDDNAAMVCAAGLRAERDGFFSERYLDAPIESVLGAVYGRPVARASVVEVCNLASRAPRVTAAFIREIAELGGTSGFDCSFFTLTRRLSVMVERLGVDLTYLAEADYRRIPDFERWGEYYAHQPKVYAAAKSAFARARLSEPQDVRHAHVV
ncbi:MAG: thermostable hemolysin [Roseiarcus sp.]